MEAKAAASKHCQTLLTDLVVRTHNHNASGSEPDGVVGSAHILAKVGSRDIADEEVARVAPDSDLGADLLPMFGDTEII